MARKVEGRFRGCRFGASSGRRERVGVGHVSSGQIPVGDTG